MREVALDDARIVNETTRRFLSHLTRCHFAPAHVKGQVVAGPPVTAVFAGEIEREDVAIVDDALNHSAEEGVVAILVFPELRTAEDIARLIDVLAAGERWRVTLPPRGDHPYDDALVGLWWTTPAGDKTSVMGLAPLGEMPVTRRAPHVALIAWCGPHLNEHTPPTAREGEVGLVSMPLPEVLRDPEAYKAAWKKTRADVRAATSFPRDGAARPHLAFSLPAALRERIAPRAVACDERGLPQS